MAYCGNPERLGDGSASLQLPTNRPWYYIRDALPGHDREEIAGWIGTGFSRWTKVANLIGKLAATPADASAGILIVITVDDLGSGGVLADMQLPFPGVRQLTMRINNRINWVATDGQMKNGTIDPVRVVTHEIGHALGVTHLQAGPPPDLMEPTISQGIIGPQATEAKLVAGWFGPPTSQPPAPPSGWIAKTFYIPSTGIPAGPQKIVPWTG